MDILCHLVSVPLSLISKEFKRSVELFGGTDTKCKVPLFTVLTQAGHFHLDLKVFPYLCYIIQ